MDKELRDEIALWEDINDKLAEAFRLGINFDSNNQEPNDAISSIAKLTNDTHKQLLALIDPERRRKEAQGITRCVQCGSDATNADETGGLCPRCFNNLERIAPALKKILEGK